MFLIGDGLTCPRAQSICEHTARRTDAKSPPKHTGYTFGGGEPVYAQ
jgi:hypothetical protein